MNGDYQSITRRIIAIAFSLCGAGVLTILAIQGSEPALTALIAIVSAISGFYFGAKSNGL
uniref:Uncharacterized protein n=1 Tax=viral metagenome TaxID=1070528 RepID=A0A6M3KWV4_9ZZZZ